MPIAITCECGKRFRAKDEYAGRRTKCPICGRSLTIPEKPAERAPEQVDREPTAQTLHQCVECGGDFGSDDVLRINEVYKSYFVCKGCHGSMAAKPDNDFLYGLNEWVNRSTTSNPLTWIALGPVLRPLLLVTAPLFVLVLLVDGIVRGHLTTSYRCRTCNSICQSSRVKKLSDLFGKEEICVKCGATNQIDFEYERKKQERILILVETEGKKVCKTDLGVQASFFGAWGELERIAEAQVKGGMEKLGLYWERR